MARPPRRSARKAPGSVLAVAYAADHDEAAPAGTAFAETVDPQAVLAQFEAALREEQGIGEEGLDFLMPFLRDAVEQASLAPAEVRVDPVAWMAAFDTVVGNSLEEDERNALVRRLNEAVEPLADDRTRVALEFANRIQSDGQAAALAWLEQQKLAVDETPQSQAPGHERAPAGAQAITRSRSRRLRGPPA